MAPSPTNGIDSLLQDLERATTNLKNNPGNPGGWKLNRPGDATIANTPSYTSARVAKRYSPQYYAPEEPLYQNESIRRSHSNASSHDYAAVNGRSTTPRTPTTPTSPMHEGGGTSVVARRPLNASGRNAVASTDLGDASDVISQKLSMLDSLLDDLNAARRSYDQPDSARAASYSATLPNRNSAHSPTNGYASLNRLQVHDCQPGMYPGRVLSRTRSVQRAVVAYCSSLFAAAAVTSIKGLASVVTRRRGSPDATSVAWFTPFL